MECFGGDESSGTSSVRVARHGGDATIWLLVAFPGNPGRTRGGASWVGIRERKVPRGLRDTLIGRDRDREPVTKRSTQGKQRAKARERDLVGLRGVGLHTKESPDVMNPEGHAAGTSA